MISFLKKCTKTTAIEVWASLARVLLDKKRLATNTIHTTCALPQKLSSASWSWLGNGKRKRTHYVCATSIRDETTGGILYVHERNTRTRFFWVFLYKTEIRNFHTPHTSVFIGPYESCTNDMKQPPHILCTEI